MSQIQQTSLLFSFAQVRHLRIDQVRAASKEHLIAKVHREFVRDEVAYIYVKFHLLEFVQIHALRRSATCKSLPDALYINSTQPSSRIYQIQSLTL